MRVPFAALLITLLGVQFLAGLSHISDPFIDGRYHYNWAPAFWLNNARATNEAGIVNSVFGIATGVTRDEAGAVTKISYYASHPQLLGPVNALWSRAFGYSERSGRMLALALTVATTVLFAFAFRKAFGNAFGLLACALFAALPLIAIYGKRLDFENLVIVWLAVAFLGYLKLLKRERFALPVVYAGLIGLTLSDWSGFVLAFTIGLTSFLFLHEDRTFAKRVLAVAGISILAGIVIFALQNYAQGGYASIGEFFSRYAELFRYRTNADTESIAWPLWAFKQWVHVRMNFSATLFLLAVAGLTSAAVLAVKRRKALPIAERAAAWFAAAAFLGGIAWIVLIKQGSFVHLSYQYFLSVPVAFGAVWLIRAAATATIKNHSSRDRMFVGFGILLVLFSSWHAYRTYTTLLYRDFNGDATDLALVKSLRDLPQEADIVAIGDENEVEWWSAPNIEYYVGYSIKAQSFENVPLVPYQIVPVRFSEKIRELISNGGSYGVPYPTAVRQCSTNFCLLEVSGIGSE